MSDVTNKLEGIRQMLDKNVKLDMAPAFIASDFVNCWEILMNAPGTARIAILFEDAKARVNFPDGDITGREDQYIDVMISRGRGLEQVRSGNLMTGSGGGHPLFQLAQDMRDMLRAIHFDPQTDERTNYIGFGRWGKDEGFNIDAFVVHIWVGSQLNMISETSDTNPNTAPI